MDEGGREVRIISSVGCYFFFLISCATVLLSRPDIKSNPGRGFITRTALQTQRLYKGNKSPAQQPFILDYELVEPY